MSILNKTNTRAFILETARRYRPAAGFTRVSEDFIEQLELELRVSIAKRVHAMPSNGKTIK